MGIHIWPSWFDKMYYNSWNWGLRVCLKSIPRMKVARACRNVKDNNHLISYIRLLSFQPIRYNSLKPPTFVSANQIQRWKTTYSRWLALVENRQPMCKTAHCPLPVLHTYYTCRRRLGPSRARFIGALFCPPAVLKQPHLGILLWVEVDPAAQNINGPWRLGWRGWWQSQGCRWV